MLGKTLPTTRVAAPSRGKTAIFDLLFLLLVANGAPILARNVCGRFLGRPFDGGMRLRDGEPLFGRSKTWRGILCAVILPAVVAPVVGRSPELGAMVGALAMAGDLFSSFIKRRLHMAPSARAPGVDQLPEALLPAGLLRESFALSWLEVLLAAAAFMLLGLALSGVLYTVGIRRRPH